LALDAVWVENSEMASALEAVSVENSVTALPLEAVSVEYSVTALAVEMKKLAWWMACLNWSLRLPILRRSYLADKFHFQSLGSAS
jgi:hypothetical protein